MGVVPFNQHWKTLRGNIQKGVEGKNVYLPNPHLRLKRTFNIVPGRFTLLGSTSGAGKSAFIDDLYIHKVRQAILAEHFDAHYEVLYYAMERNVASKHNKWLTWMLHDRKGWIMDSEQLMGRYEDTLTDVVLEAIDELQAEFEDLTEKVHIYDRRISADLIRKHVNERAEKLGILYTSDSIGVTKGKDTAYIATFGDNDKLLLKHKGEEFIMERDSHKYFFHNPKTYLFIILDGVGIIDATGFPSTKAAVDNVTNLLADARDVYNFNPVMVSQFNRGISDSQRAKMHGSSLAPAESDFKDSSNMYQAADLVVGLFDPYKFKAYNKQGMYGGYDILNGMMSPFGHNRFRSAHVLKNTYGKDGGVFGMRFTGEIGRFDILPRFDSNEIQQIYAEIAAGL